MLYEVITFQPVVACAVALASLVLLARHGAGAGNWISFAKILAFLVLIIGAAVAFGGRPAGTASAALTPLFPLGLAGVFAAMGYVFIALEGFEIIA